ncbi:hypothetical protein [Haloplanus salilacus]|uniref:hypothetical protein n=1 Tax=Haloplanus salilacus TaxID=2949994 RepID=UPI0030CFDEF3
MSSQNIESDGCDCSIGNGLSELPMSKDSDELEEEVEIVGDYDPEIEELLRAAKRVALTLA